MALPSRNISTYELPVTSGYEFLLLEDGTYMLQESSERILLEAVAPSQILPSRNVSSYTLPARN